MYGVLYFVCAGVGAKIKGRGGEERSQGFRGWLLCGECKDDVVERGTSTKKPPPPGSRRIGLRMQWRFVLRNASQKIRIWPWAASSEGFVFYCSYPPTSIVWEKLWKASLI